MTETASPLSALSWRELEKLAPIEKETINGPTNSYSKLRLFGKSEKDVNITFYRDNHAWCPYCQKIWLWLEFKQIPYRVKKVTMRCYGKKESWYLEKVSSGMLPAVEINHKIITESDLILINLEQSYGYLGSSMEDEKTINLRRLERQLFVSWCQWLCKTYRRREKEQQVMQIFRMNARQMEQEIAKNESGWLDPHQNKTNSNIPGTADIVFIPYLERMNASLAYYKGYSIREEHPLINNWFSKLEQLEEYRGTQSDMHTHAHDLPPQMGGCWTTPNKQQKIFSDKIDTGKGLDDLETTWNNKNTNEDELPKNIALRRVLKHRHKLLSLNPLGSNHFDQPLRAALTGMIKDKWCNPEKGSAKGLRYLRDRISVPRDMPLLPARELRQALERTASMDSKEEGEKIPTRHRLDQNPAPFQ